MLKLIVMSNGNKGRVLILLVALLIISASMNFFFIKRNAALSEKRDQLALHADSLLSVKLKMEHQFSMAQEDIQRLLTSNSEWRALAEERLNKILSLQKGGK